MLLEELARRVEIDFLGYGAETLDKGSPILPRHHGEVWGLDMYKALLSSKITINRHIDVAENYANNMRLYEATGCGALLITDYKDNLNKLFEIGKEVVAYKSVDELVELVQYYSTHEDERRTVADAGQKRTLSEHTYYNRMAELLEIIRKYFKEKRD
jgi:spore maturation protein CgeB